MAMNEDTWDLCRKAFMPFDPNQMPLGDSESCRLKSEPPLAASVILQLKAATSLEDQLAIIAKSVFPRALVSVRPLSPREANRMVYHAQKLDEFLGPSLADLGREEFMNLLGSQQASGQAP
jgi:hypothetical protein